jgi:murein DD-endopeptidase MepM/ murein hydrolase activator NlpD
MAVSAGASLTSRAKLYGPQEVYIGTDAFFLVNRPGVARVQVIMRRGVESRIVATESGFTREGDSWYSVTLSGNLLVEPGEVELVLASLNSANEKSEEARLLLVVKEVSETAALADSELDGIQSTLTSTRWFFDLDRAGGMMNGKDLNGIHLWMMSPFRSGGSETWPKIIWSHNSPAAGTTNDTVTPHRGLDIYGSNGTPFYAVIEGVVHEVSNGPSLWKVTTKTHLGDGVYLYVQYEHANSPLKLNDAVTTSTQLGTIQAQL